MNRLFNFTLAALIVGVPMAGDAQVDPPRPGCCFQIYAAGVRLGQVASHMYWLRNKSGWNAPTGVPDTTMVDHMVAAGDHVVMANLDCSKFNQAWPGAEAKRGQLRSMIASFQRDPSPPVRASLASMLRDTYRWGAELAVQRANEQIVRAANCEQKYFEYGWLLGHAVQTLRIADEAQQTRVTDDRPLLTDARGTLNRFLAEYKNYPDWNYSFYATRSCVPIDDLGVDRLVERAVRSPDTAVASMIALTDQSLMALQQRLVDQCLVAPLDGRGPGGQPFGGSTGPGNWQGRYRCEGARYPTPFILTISGRGRDSVIRASYPASTAGPAASDEYRIDTVSETQAGGEYVYRLAADARQWLGTWKIQFRDGALRLERWDRSSPWYGDAICRREGDAPMSDNSRAADGATGCRAVVGVWSWFVNGDVTFTADGRFTQGALGGRWTCAGTSVRMQWNHGYTDELVVSPDGRRLSGTGYLSNQPAGPRHEVHGTRR